METEIDDASGSHRLCLPTESAGAGSTRLPGPHAAGEQGHAPVKLCCKDR